MGSESLKDQEKRDLFFSGKEKKPCGEQTRSVFPLGFTGKEIHYQTFKQTSCFYHPARKKLS